MSRAWRYRVHDSSKEDSLALEEQDGIMQEACENGGGDARRAEEWVGGLISIVVVLPFIVWAVWSWYGYIDQVMSQTDDFHGNGTRS